MKPRFTIRRKSVEYPNPSPWAVKDAERPAFVGQYARLDLAVKAIDAKLREEKGAPAPLFTDPSDTDEILAEMRKRRAARESRFERHTNAPCALAPALGSAS